MLKLEKSSTFSGIAVRLREKERFFDSSLLMALGIALGFHLFGLVLFHISPLSESSSFLFPPVQVQSENMETFLSILSSSQDREQDFSLPSFWMSPDLEWNALKIESPLLTAFHPDPSPFQTLEESRWPIWHAPLTIPFEENLIQLTISGELATFPFTTHDPLFEKKISFSPNQKRFSNSYYVQVDGKTGRLIGLERAISSGRKEMDQMIDKIASTLTFDIYQDDIVTGKLHFSFFIEELSHD